MPADSLTADVVVVGTGAGGGPAAAVLAEAGLDTLVLESGSRLGASDFTGDEGAMTRQLWTMDLSASSGVALYAGSCVGGSTVINDALCFRTPPEVLAGWRTGHGLSGLTDAAFAPWVERAWTDVHAEPTGPSHRNRNAARLAAGATALGWTAAPTPRNVRDCANLGLCNFGCPADAKQSTLLAYVPRAERAGARVLADVRVDRIVVAGGTVVAVEATQLDPVTRAPRGALRVRTPRVMAAAGVLGTPALLQRSGVTAPGLGEGLQLHTSVHVAARFAEPVHGYYGPTMSYAIAELSDVHGHGGPGIMIESVASHPIATASALPGFGAAHADAMARLPYLARALVVIRDRTRGRIDAQGTIRHAPEPADLELLRQGIAAAARAYLAAGAIEVHLPVNGTAPVRTERDLEALRSARLSPSAFSLLYAVHLFGGATMAGSSRAPLTEDGACRGVLGLWVSDASSLPTNTGVNPQITIMANALRIADGVKSSRTA